MLHIPPPQQLTVIAPFSEVMVGTCRRATASRSSTDQESRCVIQILQDRTTLILKPMYPNGK